MKILVLGANGTLGHKLYQVLSSLFEVIGTVRGASPETGKRRFFREAQIVPNVDAREISRMDRVIEEAKPDVVINSIGIVKQMEKEAGLLFNVWLNSLFPHQLYQICQARGIRLIHISTDCVFSGRTGSYREDDPSDAEDIYGKTKYLGEVNEAGALTIRTSFIGRELASTNGLLEWFLSNRGSKVRGFSNAIFSGFTTVQLAGIIADIIADHQNLSGLYHISSEPISKFKLLTLINDAMELNIDIEEYPDFHCDRSLDSTRYREENGFIAPSWHKMVGELAQDAIRYLEWR